MRRRSEVTGWAWSQWSACSGIADRLGPECALRADIHAEVASESLGHATISITLDTRSRAMPTVQEEAAARIAGLVFADMLTSGGLLTCCRARPDSPSLQLCGQRRLSRCGRPLEASFETVAVRVRNHSIVLKPSNHNARSNAERTCEVHNALGADRCC